MAGGACHRSRGSPSGGDPSSPRLRDVRNVRIDPGLRWARALRRPARSAYPSTHPLGCGRRRKPRALGGLRGRATRPAHPLRGHDPRGAAPSPASAPHSAARSRGSRPGTPAP